MHTKKFNVFDKVLVKDASNKWQIDFYAYWDEENNSHHTMSFGGVVDISNNEILPFEEYSHLLGRTDEPEEEVMLEEGECCIFFDDMENLRKVKNLIVDKIIGRDMAEDAFWQDGEPNLWKYAIRFSDFNPEYMEETKKHILCVRNGKIVRYRG